MGSRTCSGPESGVGGKEEGAEWSCLQVLVQPCSYSDLIAPSWPLITPRPARPYRACLGRPGICFIRLAATAQPAACFAIVLPPIAAKLLSRQWPVPAVSGVGLRCRDHLVCAGTYLHQWSCMCIYGCICEYIHTGTNCKMCLYFWLNMTTYNRDTTLYICCMIKSHHIWTDLYVYILAYISMYFIRNSSY